MTKQDPRPWWPAVTAARVAQIDAATLPLDGRACWPGSRPWPWKTARSTIRIA